MAFIIASCGDNNEKSYIPAGSGSDSVALNQPAPAATPSAQGTAVEQLPPATVNTAPVQPTAEGMNPPHGEPNHRCDIAVGAPLSSPPNAKTDANKMTLDPTQQVQQGTTQINVNEPSKPVVTAEGMNPPHGEPGHDCSVAVGAPLKK
jgi:hypothetical protein